MQAPLVMIRESLFFSLDRRTARIVPLCALWISQQIMRRTSAVDAIRQSIPCTSVRSVFNTSRNLGKFFFFQLIFSYFKACINESFLHIAIGKSEHTLLLSWFYVYLTVFHLIYSSGLN